MSDALVLETLKQIASAAERILLKSDLQAS